jgi:hypothetical protein
MAEPTTTLGAITVCMIELLGTFLFMDAEHGAGVYDILSWGIVLFMSGIVMQHATHRDF